MKYLLAAALFVISVLLGGQLYMLTFIMRDGEYILREPDPRILFNEFFLLSFVISLLIVGVVLTLWWGDRNKRE